MTRYVAVFANRRMLVTLLLGFSSGLPLALIGGTLQAWLANSKIDIATIGQFALVGLPYALKFLWAPLLDSKALPFLGLRRGWMVICQLGLFAATVGLGLTDPTRAMGIFSFMALLVAFFSASQDIVVDAYRTEIIADEGELGAGASAYITGYRIATVVSGGVALVLSDHMSWTAVYTLMAFVNLIGLVTILMSREPAVTRKVVAQGFRDSVMLPFLEFFQRGGAMEILIFIMVYKISTLMATALTTKFLIDLGYSNTMIGAVNKGAGLIATITGTLVGGSLMTKLGLKRSLWVFGVIQSLVGVTYFALARLGPAESALRDLWLVVIVSMDNFMMGLGTAALVGFMMNFCSKRYTGTQYALLTSVMAVTRVILVAHAGTLVKWLGYDMFFLLTVPMAIPGLLLLRRFDHWEQVADVSLHTKIPKLDLGMIALFVTSLILLSADPLWRWLATGGTPATVATLNTMAGITAEAGALGVVVMVLIGLLRPYGAKLLWGTPGRVRSPG
jgi:PAT family beta-lactamase induction signal transducer AmpG